MISSGGESKGCFTTFVDEKVDFIPRSRWAQTDRGKEFVCHIAIKEQLGLTLYFVNAYSSWQQGSNENSNGLLGEFYTKKRNLAMVHQEELTNNLILMNARPLKCLGGKSLFMFFYTSRCT